MSHPLQAILLYSLVMLPKIALEMLLFKDTAVAKASFYVWLWGSVSMLLGFGVALCFNNPV